MIFLLKQSLSAQNSNEDNIFIFNAYMAQQMKKETKEMNKMMMFNI